MCYSTEICSLYKQLTIKQRPMARWMLDSPSQIHAHLTQHVVRHGDCTPVSPGSAAKFGEW